MTDETEPRTPIRSLDVEELIAQVEAETPAPGGGSAASVAGALGASLLHMTARYSVEESSDRMGKRSRLLDEIREQSRRLLDLAEQDRRAYELYQELRQDPDANESEKGEALLRSTRIPLEMNSCCKNVLTGFAELREEVKSAFEADVNTALELIRVTWHAASNLASYNIDLIRNDTKKRELRNRLEEQREEIGDVFERLQES